jgi:hypothetical protein
VLRRSTLTVGRSSEHTPFQAALSHTLPALTFPNTSRTPQTVHVSLKCQEELGTGTCGGFGAPLTPERRTHFKKTCKYKIVEPNVLLHTSIIRFRSRNVEKYKLRPIPRGQVGRPRTRAARPGRSGLEPSGAWRSANHHR